MEKQNSARTAVLICEVRRIGKVKDLTGKRFGRLTVLNFVGIKNRYAVWRCICDCGQECEVATDVLSRKGIHSCGCFAKDHLKEMSKNNITHGLTGSRLLGCYKNMMSRCYREKDIHYNAYGKRGIVVCEEWRTSKQAFIDWALSHGYSDDLTLERVNVNGNYEPSNCKWIPMKEQYKNKQSNYMKNAKPYNADREKVE